MPLVATYRVQLTPTSGFAAVARHLSRIRALGISHLYLSPVTEAVSGSTHGYDVVDHTRVREELGGLDGLLALLDSLAAQGMAAIVDHVPNHVAVGQSELNPRWWDMLRDGPGSPAASWFDVDWDAGDNRVILPVLDRSLDDALDAGEVRIVDAEDGSEPQLRVGGLRFPLAAGTAPLHVAAAVAAQHYRLQHWRAPERNVRRFFTIDDLVAVRVEDPSVARAVDTVPRLLADHPGFGGVRVDHIDGLADPAGYLRGLRAVIGDCWLLVEKILAPGETLPADWPVDGTTGYEHARVLEHAMLDGTGFAALTRRWAETTGDDRPWPAWELPARREALTGSLRPDVERVARAAVAAGVGGRDGPRVAPDVVEAVVELSAHLRRYRTYLPGDGPGAGVLGAARHAAVAARPELAPTIDRLVAAIAGDGDEVRVRWQQLTGPATAKGVEDRAFFRYLPLATLCEVGGDPVPGGPDPVGALHEWHLAMKERWPTTMLAGTTHDTKRSEDVRARGLALAAVAGEWSTLVDAWSAADPPGGMGEAIDAGTRWLALQTAVTAGPLTAERLREFVVKAAREAAVRTSWADPDEMYEAALGDLASRLVAWPPAGTLAAALDRDGRARSLAMLAVRLTAPGVADVYQGTEAFRFVLTDPDNRTEPDHDALARLVARAADLDGAQAWAEPSAPAARAVVLRRVLVARRRAGPLAGYRPLTAGGGDAGGGDAEQVIAFARTGPDGTPVLITAVARNGLAGVDATLPLPSGEWGSVLDDAAPVASTSLALGPVLEAFPACVLTPA